MNYYFADEVAVILLSNISSAITSPAAAALGAIYFREAHEPFPAFRLTPLTAEEAARVAGVYQFGVDYYVPNSKVIIANRRGFLYAEYPSGYPASPLLTVSPVSFIARPFWGKFEFVIGAEGRASELVIDGMRGSRVE